MRRKPSYFTSCSQSDRDGTKVPRVGRFRRKGKHAGELGSRNANVSRKFHKLPGNPTDVSGPCSSRATVADHRDDNQKQGEPAYSTEDDPSPVPLAPSRF